MPIRKELPERWYVLYKTREEFDLIDQHFEKNWTYYEGDCYGYTNADENDDWIDFSDRAIDATQIRVDRENIIKISFQDFRVLVLGEVDPEIFTEPAIECLYLIDLFRRLNLCQ
jgi:hypothetical protein